MAIEQVGRRSDPGQIDTSKVNIVTPTSTLSADSTSFLLDNEWSKNAFLLPDEQLQVDWDIANRYWSSAAAKFTDTTVGGNIGINSRPQFTWYSDIRNRGRLSGRNDVSIGSTTGNFGMGRYYSEAIDDPSQTIYLRFGVPQFNSISNFFSRAFDSDLMALARTGRGNGFWFTAGQAITGITIGVAFKSVAVIAAAGMLVNSAFKRPTSKFYTLKPTMYNYWSTVNVLVNSLAVNLGILPKLLSSEDQQRAGQPFQLDQEYMGMLQQLLPDVFRGNNYLDMYSIANRASRIANQAFAEDFDSINNDSPTDWTGYVYKLMTGDGTHATKIMDKNGSASLASRINRMTMIGNYKITKDDQGHAMDVMEKDPRIGDDGNENIKDDKLTELAKDLDAEFREGSAFAVFKVDFTGSVSESFGNSSVESDLGKKLNETSSQAREARFSFAEGNVTGGDGLVGDVVGAVTGALGNLVAGGVDILTFGNGSLVFGLGGSGFIDIPKHWQSSTATLPRNNYSIQLISPYGNPISQLINIYIPLAMILAGTLPLSTGKASYTSPFLCQLFDRGKCQIRLGMIESLSITRGTSNLPFNIKGTPLAIDINFTVADLSSIMHMPVSTGDVFSVDMSLDEDNILSDYLAVLAGQDIYSQIYPMAKAKLSFAKKIMGLSRLTSPAYWGSLFHESTTNGIMSYLTLGTANVLEGVNRGASVLNREPN